MLTRLTASAYITDVKEFISGRRHETLTLHYVLQGFSIAECYWLIPPGLGMKKQGRVSVTDALKRRELLEEFMFWYFDSFVLPLIKVLCLLLDCEMVTDFFFADNFLCHKFVSIPESSVVFPPRRLGSSLCAPDRSTE